MWAPPPGAHLTADEEEVVGILSRLPDLILERNHRRRPVFAGWGVRRKRSALSDNPPPPLAGDAGGEQPNDGGVAVAVSSPATPLSFDPSGSEEAAADPKGLLVRPPPIPHPPKAFKNAKRHKEWVKEQNQTISSLSAEGVNLNKSLEEAKRRHQMLKAWNLWMREIRLKLQSPMEVIQNPPPPEQRQQVYGRSNSVDVAPVRPAALLPLQPAYPAAGNRLQGERAAGRAETAAFPIGRRRRPEDSGAVTASFRHEVGCSAVGGAVPDLNSIPEAAEERMGLELGLGLQQSSYSTAEARKRRMKIRREKSSGGGGGGAHSSMAYHIAPFG